MRLSGVAGCAAGESTDIRHQAEIQAGKLEKKYITCYVRRAMCHVLLFLLRR
jgi:hypothetical protein